MHPALALEPQDGCTADRRCIQRQAPEVRARSRARLASRCAALLLPGLRLRHVDLLPIFKRIGRVDDDPVRGRDATQNLQRGHFDFGTRFLNREVNELLSEMET